MSNLEEKQQEYTAQLFETQADILSCLLTGPIREEALKASTDEIIASINKSGICTVPEENLDDFKTVLFRKADRTLLKYDRYLNDKIFRVPDHVLLPEDSIQAEQFSVEDINRIKEEMEQTKRAIMNAKYMIAALSTELEEIEQVNKVFQPIETRFEKIVSSYNPDSVTTVLEKTRALEVAMTKLPAPIPKADEGPLVNKLTS